jgi:hypothetical protein
LAARPVCQAEENHGENWFHAVGRRDWLANYDPTLIGRRVTSEFSFEDDRGGQSTTKLDLTVRDSWSVTDGLAFGLQVELPIKWVDTGADTAGGLGNFETRAGVVGRITKHLRWGTALNLSFPTASNPALDTNILEIRPIAALSWDAASWLNFGVNAAYSITPADTDTVNKLELKFPVAVEISPDWSAAVTYKPTISISGDAVEHALEMDITRLLGDKRQFAITPGMEVPLSKQSLEWKVILGAAWYF